MKIDHCILCQSAEFQLVHQKGRRQYLRCQGCGLVCIDPRPGPDDLTASYRSYLPEGHQQIKDWETMMRPIVVKSTKMIRAAHGPGTGCLLDIGSGLGFFMEEMQSRGWEVSGIELSETGRTYTEKRIKCQMYSRPLETLHLSEARFDVVTLFYVIEHLPDPVSTVKEVFRILKPGGRILLRWPHSTPIVRVLGPFSRMLDLYHTPFHLYDFSPATIHMLLTSAAFEGIRTTIGGYSLPSEAWKRVSATLTGILAEALNRCSGGRLLLPGVSKTTMAQKPEASIR